MDGPVALRALTDGGQSAEEVASAVVGFLGTAHTSLDLALYDVRLPGPVGDAVAGALKAAHGRGVQVRIAYNVDDVRRVPVPPPASTQPEILAELGLPLRGVGGEPDLMHHKYVVRDGTAVWTGSMNWTLDSWTRQENVVAVVESAAVAAAYHRDFEELWRHGRVEGTGEWDVRPVELDGGTVRPWFCPGRGEALAHRIAKAIGRARRRVRIASPVLTSGPVLGTLAEVCAEARVDVTGVVDWTQVHEVFGQWGANPRSAWKGPLLARVLEQAAFTGKRSTPWAPGALHDYMHAKVTVADDVVFVGSYNLSRSGELNAENVLEVHHAPTADAMAAFVDAVRARYPDVVPPPS
ncbi:MAG: phosphatidylserine/phosphatidylglycerophosphate/cardiolipin synthase family protein [Solirubrobacterales bacterium]|nr:phosphatidylserine/phosphatidylglycerophosphate/cardiolipin synthase family protein [Solirubrobacterales bacterium]